MTDTKKLSEMTALAEAAYGDFYTGGVLRTDAADVISKLVQGTEWSLTQARDLVTRYRVVHQQSNTAAGFSATVFERLTAAGAPTGEYVFAARGTEIELRDLRDLAADLSDLVRDGLAWEQIVDMYNYWQRLTTAPGATYQQATLVTATLEAGSAGQAILDGALGTSNVTARKIVLTPATDGLGLLSATATVEATGHSLGGHLSFSFSRLFPANTTTAYGANGAGYANVLAGANVSYVFGALGGATTFDASKVQNLYGSAGPAIVTQNAPSGLVQVGSSEMIFIEQGGLFTLSPLRSASAVFGHSAQQMTDSMAVYDLLFHLDRKSATQSPGAVAARFLGVFEGSSNDKATSLERTTESIAKLVGVDSSGIAVNDREALHARIKLIRDSEVYQALSYGTDRVAGQLEISAQFEPSAARSDFAAFLSLQLVLPFGLRIADPAAELQLASAHPVAYAQWLADKNLTPIQLQAGRASFSESWIADRGALLDAVAAHNLRDGEGSAYVAGMPKDRARDFVWVDAFGMTRVLVAENAARAGGVLTPVAHQVYAFGGDGADTFTGLSNNLGDHLYGAGGNDILTGLEGNDFLEGGKDFDTYVFSGAFGHDSVVDSDGSGVIKIDDAEVTGGKKVTENVWEDDAKTLVFTQTSLGLVIGRRTAAGASTVSGTIVVKGWSNNQLGITLDSASAPRQGRIFRGDQHGIVDSLDQINWAATSWAADGTLVGGVLEENFNDVISGTDNADQILGLGGNDGLNGGWGADFVDGGSGDDLIAGGGGSDVINGGNGNDFIVSAAWVDLTRRFYAHETWERHSDAPTILHGSNWGVGQNDAGWFWIASFFATLGASQDSDADTVNAGAGNDYVIGSLGADWLSGGADDDQVWGHAGDDIVLGEGGNDDLVGDGIFPVAQISLITETDPGDHGDDVLDGGEGDDKLKGMGGNDRLYGGEHSDYLQGDDSGSALPGHHHGDDYLDGGEGNDFLWGDGGNDALYGGDQNDQLHGDGKQADLNGQYHGDDQLDGGAGEDLMFGGGGNDVLYGGSENDNMWGDDVFEDLDAVYQGNDWLDGGSGDDWLFGGAGDDVLIGGSGVDYFDGGAGDDVFEVELGEALTDSGGRNSIRTNLGAVSGVRVSGTSLLLDFAEPSAEDGSESVGSITIEQAFLGGSFDLNGEEIDDDWLSRFSIEAQTTGHNQVLRGFRGNDTLQTWHSGATLDGGAGNDLIRGNYGNDVLIGGAGSNTLEGGAGDDELVSSGDEDVLRGGGGNDVYRISAAAGQITIQQTPASWQEFDILVLPGTETDSRVAAQRQESDLVLAVTLLQDDGGGGHVEVAGPVVRVAGYFAARAFNVAGSFASIQRADGSELDLAALLQVPSSSGYGTAADDILEGGTGNDILRGYEGNDTLRGGAGDDTYVFAPLSSDASPEADVIQDMQGSNVIALGAGVNLASLRVVHESDELTTLYMNGRRVEIRGGGATGFDVEVDGQLHSMDEFIGQPPELGVDGALTDVQLAWLQQRETQARAAIDATALRGGFGSFTTAQSAIWSFVQSDEEYLEVGLPSWTSQLQSVYHRIAGGFIDRFGNPVTEFGTGIWGGLVAPNITSGSVILPQALEGEALLAAISALVSAQRGVSIDAYYILPVINQIGEVVAYDWEGIDRSMVEFETWGYEDVEVWAQTQHAHASDVVLGEGSTYLNMGAGVVHAGAGNDQVQAGSNWHWQPTEAVQAALLQGGAGAYLDGGDGDDQLSGTVLDDVLYGGRGHDWLQGGSGRDRYLVLDYGLSSDDADFIQDTELTEIYPWEPGGGETFSILRVEVTETSSSQPGGWNLPPDIDMDTVEFGPGILLEDVEFSIRRDESSDMISPGSLVVAKQGRDLAIISLVDQAALPGQGIEVLQFSDGRTLSMEQALALAGVVAGTNADDTLTGSSGDDVIDGRAGADTMAGLAGDDVFIVDSAEDSVVESVGQGVDTVETLASYVLGSNVENLRLRGYESLNGTGNDLGNTLTGNFGSNRLDGGAGADRLLGGSGDDGYALTIGGGIDEVIDSDGELDEIVVGGGVSAADLRFSRNGMDITVSIAGTQDALVLRDWYGAGRIEQVAVDGTVIDAAAIEAILSNQVPEARDDMDNVAEDGAAAFGNVLANDTELDLGQNLLVSNAGTYQGQYGTLTLAADGVYSYEVDASLPLVQALGAGDTLSEQFSYSITDDGASPAGSSALLQVTITGTNDAPVLAVAVSGQQIQEGSNWSYSVPADAFTDVDSNDTLTYSVRLVDGAGLPAWLTFDPAARTLAGTPERGNVGDLALVLTATDAAGASASQALTLSVTPAPSLTLAGTAGADTLTGGAGDDHLDGLVGGDTMIGGAGNDSYKVNTSGDVVTELADEGTDTVYSTAAYTLAANLENLVLTGCNAVNATGNALNNRLQGNAAANTLNGGAGSDIMLGDAGDDIYKVDNAGDVVIENAGGGADVVHSTVTVTLTDHVESLVLMGSSAINGYGNALNNWMQGNSAANVFDGGIGADSMLGQGDNDTYFVDDLGDFVVENAGEGADTVHAGVSHTLGANVENLVQNGSAAINGGGNALANWMQGNDAANVLTGGGGNDYLNGMGGDDTLDGGTGDDTYGFNRGAGSDVLVESGTDANDVGQFGDGISIDQLWFTQSGSNLQVQVIGSTDYLTVRDWYATAGTQRVDWFKTSDGHALQESHVQNLVNAMASFAPPPAGQTTLSPAYQTALSPTIAANWQ